MSWTLTAFVLVVTLGGATGCKRGNGASGVDAAGHVASDRAAQTRPAGPAAGSVEVADPRPDAPSVLIIAGLKGYTEPCGCTEDLLLGGIERVVGFTRSAAATAGGSVVVDAGNTLFAWPDLDPADIPQERSKAPLIVDALRRMNVVATVPGPNDLALGADFYREQFAGTGIHILAANLGFDDGAQPEAQIQVVVESGDGSSETIGIVGAVDPALFRMDGVTTTAAADAATAAAEAARQGGAETVVLLFAGDIDGARAQLRGAAGIDFIVIGVDPRQTDELEQIGGAWTLEAHDQGRYVGRLKLHRPTHGATATTSWRNAVSGSDAERARLSEVIAELDAQIAQIEAASPDPAAPPPILGALVERRSGFATSLDAMAGSAPAFDAGGPRFLYEPIPIEPGLPEDDEIRFRRETWNRGLAEINLANAPPPQPAAEGAASYVGAETCRGCHGDAYAFWQTTNHSHAIQTLVDRDKEYDRSCVGCHVTGWRQPGGSTLGHTDGLENVQCESCHGPGSLHAASPAEWTDSEHGVARDTPPAVCTTCHNDEHSPRFVYHEWRSRIVGPGHGN